MKKVPVEIKRNQDSSVAITWDDGALSLLPWEKLRRLCPCAECREKRGDTSHSAPLSPKKSNPLKVISADLKEETTLEALWPIGSYAVGMRWADGHQTGIYTYQYLNEIAGDLN